MTYQRQGGKQKTHRLTVDYTLTHTAEDTKGEDADPIMTKATRDIQAKYNRLASTYDIQDAIPERLFYRSWRRQLWNQVTAKRILEIGVGTGKNIPFYPPGAQVTAIDASTRMLEKAVTRAISRPDVEIELLAMDVSELALAAAPFDAVVGSFVLMVVPDPLKVLREIKRVCQPGGKLFLLEFTRSDNQLVAFIQARVTPLTRAIYHAQVNRDIVTMVENSGFQIITTADVGAGMVKLIQAVST